MGWTEEWPKPGRTDVREGDQVDQKKLPPIHREGVDSRAVVRGRGERGEDRRTETEKLSNIIEGEGRCFLP